MRQFQRRGALSVLKAERADQRRHQIEFSKLDHKSAYVLQQSWLEGREIKATIGQELTVVLDMAIEGGVELGELETGLCAIECGSLESVVQHSLIKTQFQCHDIQLNVVDCEAVKQQVLEVRFVIIIQQYLHCYAQFMYGLLLSDVSSSDKLYRGHLGVIGVSSIASVSHSRIGHFRIRYHVSIAQLICDHCKDSAAEYKVAVHKILEAVPHPKARVARHYPVVQRFQHALVMRHEI